MYKNNYILKLFQYMGVGIWGKKHNFIHSQRFKTIIKQQDINIIESKTIDCHVERSEISSQDSKKDFSPSLKMTRKHKMTRMLFPKMTSKQSVKDMETNVAGITHKTANAKIKGIKANKDISPTAQYDKVLESKQNLISKQNLESCNFAPLRPAPTHLDKNLESKNCHVERSEITLKDSKGDISCLRTRTSKSLAHTCKYDKVLESKQNLISKQNLESCNFAPLRPAPTHLDKNLESKNCHIERSEISSQDSKKDFSLSLKMTSKHKMTRMLFLKTTRIHKTANAKIKGIKANKDISPTAQYDKVLESKQNLISKQNLESCNFAPLRPAPTHLDKNLESKNCHIERSEISSQDSKKDFSLSLKMTSKHKMTRMLFLKTTRIHKTANAKIKGIKTKKDFSPFSKVKNDNKTQTQKDNMESYGNMIHNPQTIKQRVGNLASKKDFSLSLKMTKKQEIKGIKAKVGGIIQKTADMKTKTKNIKVKAVVLCLFSCMFYTKVLANGFKIQEQSLNATALSSAYVAGARGADASYYNPANMGFKNDWGEDKHEFEFAFSLINIPGFKFQVPTTNQGLSSVTYLEYASSLEKINEILATVPPTVGQPPIEAMPKKIELQHTTADSAMVDGSTGDTNFMLPKFFYKSKNYNGFTFGASFIAPSGLAMKWNGLGGEFLQDVFIFLIEFAPSISYTYRDRISIGFAPRLLYGMGKFNNIVYVPLGTAQQQNQNGDGSKLPEEIQQEQQQQNPNKEPTAGKNCTPAFNPDILQSLPDGLIPPDMADIFDKVGDNVQILIPALKAIGIDVPAGANKLQLIQAFVAKIQTCLVGTAQVVQKSDGSDIGFGYRASVSARVGDGGMFSVVYNSPVAMQFKGKVSADTIIGGPVGSVRMDAPLYLYVTMPEILTIAYSHDWTLKNKHKLRLEATYERTFWSRGRKFDTEFGWDEAKFTASPGSVPESFSQEQLMGMVGLADFSAVAMGNGWVDTHTFRVGATYMTKRLRLMLSAAYDKAPVPQTAIGIPDSNGYMIGLGAKYNFRDFDVGVSLSNTFKDSSSSIYASGGVGQLRIATFSLGYRW